MKEREQYIVDLFSKEEEVHLPDIVDKLFDEKQEKFIKTRSIEHATLRHGTNIVRSILRRFDIRVRSTKKLTLKRLTTERDYQLLRQKKINQRHRLDQEIKDIEAEMLNLGFEYQQVMDFEGDEISAKATKNIVSKPALQSSKESKKAVNA